MWTPDVIFCVRLERGIVLAEGRHHGTTVVEKHELESAGRDLALGDVSAVYVAVCDARCVQRLDVTHELLGRCPHAGHIKTQLRGLHRLLNIRVLRRVFPRVVWEPLDSQHEAARLKLLVVRRVSRNFLDRDGPRERLVALVNEGGDVARAHLVCHVCGCIGILEHFKDILLVSVDCEYGRFLPFTDLLCDGSV